MNVNELMQKDAQPQDLELRREIIAQGMGARRLTNPHWKYTPADKTDIRKTFERVRDDARE